MGFHILACCFSVIFRFLSTIPFFVYLWGGIHVYRADMVARYNAIHSTTVAAKVAATHVCLCGGPNAIYSVIPCARARPACHLCMHTCMHELVRLKQALFFTPPQTVLVQLSPLVFPFPGAPPSPHPFLCVPSSPLPFPSVCEESCCSDVCGDIICCCDVCGGSCCCDVCGDTCCCDVCVFFWCYEGSPLRGCETQFKNLKMVLKEPFFMVLRTPSLYYFLKKKWF
jgi:hypothetical protein